MRKPSKYRKRLPCLGNILICKDFPSLASTLARVYAEPRCHRNSEEFRLTTVKWM